MVFIISLSASTMFNDMFRSVSAEVYCMHSFNISLNSLIVRFCVHVLHIGRGSLLIKHESVKVGSVRFCYE